MDERRRTIIVLVVIIAAGAGLRCRYFCGFNHSDEMAYLQAASELASGDYRLPSETHGGHAWLPYTIVLPLAAGIRRCKRFVKPA
jgi:hypothetical protein